LSLGWSSRAGKSRPTSISRRVRGRAGQIPRPRSSTYPSLLHYHHHVTVTGGGQCHGGGGGIHPTRFPLRPRGPALRRLRGRLLAQRGSLSEASIIGPRSKTHHHSLTPLLISQSYAQSSRCTKPAFSFFRKSCRAPKKKVTVEKTEK